jgi:hypothetical protein
MLRRGNSCGWDGTSLAIAIWLKTLCKRPSWWRWKMRKRSLMNVASCRGYVASWPTVLASYAGKRVAALVTPSSHARTWLIPSARRQPKNFKRRCRKALRGFPEPYRQVLLLHLQHGLSGAEIADALARPAATIRSQVHRGLEMLRKALPAIYAGVALTAVPTACLAAMRRSLFGPPTVLKSVGSLALILTMKKLSLVAGVGNSNCGSDHPIPTSSRSHPDINPSTDLFPSQSPGHSARIPTDKHTAPHSDPGCRGLVS